MKHPPTRAASEHRIETLDALRGIASLAVAWFHFTGTEGLNDELLRQSGAYGWGGVFIFFVISGFVIPLALYRSGYKLRDYGQFLIKRIVRLDPPYIVSIALIILLGYLTTLVPGFRGEQFTVSTAQVLFHFAYINVFFGYPWLNLVFWSLAVEFQYYLAIGLLFPLLISNQRGVVAGTFAALALLSIVLPFPAFVFQYLCLFELGALTFLRYAGKVKEPVYWIGCVVLVAGTWLAINWIVAVIAAATTLLIALVRVRSRVLNFFGKISYSIYLLHVPIGAKVLNLSLRYAHNRSGKLLALLCAMGITIAAAYLLYILVEKPAQRWSSAFSFSKLGTRRRKPAMIDEQAL